MTVQSSKNYRQFARNGVCLISNLSSTSRSFWKKHNRCLFLKAVVKRTLSETLEKSDNTSSDTSFLFTEYFKLSRMPRKEVPVEWPFLKPEMQGPNKEASSKNVASCFSTNLSNISQRGGKLDGNHFPQ